MRVYRSWQRSITSYMVVVIGMVLIFSNLALGYSPQMRHAMKSGPWQIAVKTGAEGKDMYFPVEVPEEIKPYDLNNVVPFMGTSRRLKLTRYLPNFK